MSEPDAHVILEADVRHVLAWLETRNDTLGDLLYQSLDLEHIGWIGFSRGAGYGDGVAEIIDEVDFLVNIDSASRPAMSKPAYWLGNGNSGGGPGPLIHQQFPGDTHPLYRTLPGVGVDFDVGPDSPHYEMHQNYRDAGCVAFFDLYQASANVHRAFLGIDGAAEDHGGLIGPTRAERFPQAHSPHFVLADGGSQDVDAGAAPILLYGFDGGSARMFSLDTRFLEANQDLDASLLTDRGALQWVDGRGVAHPILTVDALCLDGDGQLWIAAPSFAQGMRRSALYRVDVADLVPNGLHTVERIAVLGRDGHEFGGLAAHPHSGLLYALQERPGASDHLWLFDPNFADVPYDLGPIRGAGRTVEHGSDLCFDRGGNLYVYDDCDARLLEVSVFDATVIHVVDADADAGLEPLSVRALAYESVSDTLLFADRAQDRLGVLTRADGGNESLGSLSALGLDDVHALAIAVPRTLEGAGPRVASAPRNTLANDGRPLAAARVLEPAAVFDGGRIRLQFVDDPHAADHDTLSITPTVDVQLGATVSLLDPDPRVREGIEILVGGQVVAWWIVNYGDRLTGTELLPLEIVLAAGTDGADVESILRAVQITAMPGEGGARWLRVLVQDGDGRRFHADVASRAGS